jgi:hypothetical protein
LTDTATLRIDVRACSESSPIARDGFLQTGYRQPIAVDLGSFGSNGTIVDVVGPPGFANGTYVPPEGENGTVTIRYSVVNSCRLRASGQVTIDVNRSPVGTTSSISVFRGETRVVPVTDIATDDEALTITTISGAPDWIEREPARLVISAAVDAMLGTSSFTATVVDPGGLTTEVDVSVTVVNRPPVANGDSIDVTDGDPRTVDLVRNDTDVDSSGPLVISELPSSTLSFSGGGMGSVALLSDGRRVRVDPGDGRGIATFTYRIRDDDEGVSASATVTVHAPPANQPPVASDQTISVSVGTSAIVDLQASDPDGPSPRLVDATFADPSGVVTSRSGLQLSVLTPIPGTFVVTYEVTDGDATSARATLTINASLPPSTTSPP